MTIGYDPTCRSPIDRVKAQMALTRQSSSSSDIFTRHVGSRGCSSWQRWRSFSSDAVWSQDSGTQTSPSSRIISDCHFVVQLNHFTQNFLTLSVAFFLKRQSDIALPSPRNRPATARLSPRLLHDTSLLRRSMKVPTAQLPAKRRLGSSPAYYSPGRHCHFDRK